MDINLDPLVSFDNQCPTNPILKPSLQDNLILLQTPVQKNLKVRFQTPAKTPLTLQPCNLTETLSNTTGSDQLTEEELWRERIEVVTKFDHEEYVSSAKVFIEEIVTNVVNRCTRLVQTHPLETDQPPSQKDFETVETLQEYFPEEDDKENIFPLRAKSKKKKDSVKEENDEYVKKPSSISVNDGITDTPTVITASPTLSNCISLNRVEPPATEDGVDVVFKTNTYNQSPGFTTLYSVFDGNNFEDEIRKETKDYEPYLKRSSTKSEKNKKPDKPPETCTRKVIAARSSSPEKPPAEPAPPQSLTPPPNRKQPSGTTLGDDDFTDGNILVERGFDFDLGYLETKGGKSTSSELRKQSLYLKFDPLVAGEDPQQSRSLIGRKSDIIDLQGRVSLTHFRQEQAKKPEKAASIPDLLCDSPSKYVETSSAQVQCNMSLDSKSTISKETWLSMQQPEEVKEEIVEILKYSESDVNKVKQSYEAEVASLNSKVTTQKEKIDQMQVVLQEFETTALEMAHKYDEEKNKLEMEKDEAAREHQKTITHLESVEKAYVELLERSEQMKVGIGNYKTNEETLKTVIADYQAAQETAQQRYNTLKTTMEQTQEKLLQEYDTEKKDLRSQIAALKARCKFLENQSKSLQNQLDQKTKENTELTTICDELIAQHQQAQSGSRV